VNTHPNPIPTWRSEDLAGWLIGAARDALEKTEELGDAPETLILVIQAHALLGVAAEKLQARPSLGRRHDHRREGRAGLRSPIPGRDSRTPGASSGGDRSGAGIRQTGVGARVRRRGDDGAVSDDRTVNKLAQVASALARLSLRSRDARTPEELAEATRGQKRLLAELRRDELEWVALGLAAMVSELAVRGSARPEDAERMLQSFVNAAARAEGDDPSTGDDRWV